MWELYWVGVIVVFFTTLSWFITEVPKKNRLSNLQLVGFTGCISVVWPGVLIFLLLNGKR